MAQVNRPLLDNCPPFSTKFPVEPLIVPPLILTIPVPGPAPILPPVQLNPPLSVTGLVPPSTPEEMVRVPGSQGPVPLKLTVPPEMVTALPLTVVPPVRLAVPLLNVHVPPRFKLMPILAVLPLTVRLPAPERLPELKVNVPALKLRVADRKSGV